MLFSRKWQCGGMFAWMRFFEGRKEDESADEYMEAKPLTDLPELRLLEVARVWFV